jgi:hypothetical protein
MTARIEPQIVMETENVEIIKAMVRNGIGITIIPFQAVARDVASGHLFCAPIEGRTLMRETGWVYPKMSRTPRTVQEVIRAFERVKPRARIVLAETTSQDSSISHCSKMSGLGETSSGISHSTRSVIPGTLSVS